MPFSIIRHVRTPKEAWERIQALERQSCELAQMRDEIKLEIKRLKDEYIQPPML